MKSAVLITGAGTGIGAATAKLFSQKGHDIILVGRRASKLSEVAKTLSTKTLEIPADLKKSSDVLNVLKITSEEMPHMNILVNNAGIYHQKSFQETSDELWYDTFETNLMGPVRLTRAFLPHLRTQNNAVVINIASSAGLRPLAGMVAYSTLKSALIHLTQSLAIEVAPNKIRVNCICPGIVETEIFPMSDLSADERQKIKDTWNSLHPIGRFGRPEEIAWAVYQMACEEANWITGAVLPIDGGISLV